MILTQVQVSGLKMVSQRSMGSEFLRSQGKANADRAEATPCDCFVGSAVIS